MLHPAIISCRPDAREEFSSAGRPVCPIGMPEACPMKNPFSDFDLLRHAAPPLPDSAWQSAIPLLPLRPAV